MKNVILLTLDATRKDVFGIYGNDKGISPFMDTLGENSMVFTKGHSTGPYTQSAFPGIMTSSHFLDYGKPAGLAKQRTLISEVLKRASITTAAFHSNPYCSGHFGWNRGWDTFYDSMEDDVDPKIPYIRGLEINKKVLKWLASPSGGASGKPFFLWVHYMDIHEPYVPEQKYIDLVDSSLQISQAQMYDLFENILLKRDVSEETKVSMLQKLYNIHIREVDSYVQELFAALERLDLLRDTAVIITSDHGDEFNEHGGLSHDHKLYSELVNVPLILYGLDESGVSDKVVSTIDIAPTILHLFGLNPEPSFKGSSLVPVAAYKEKGVFGEAIDQKSQRGGDINKDVYYYRQGDLKIIYYRYLDQYEMYDLQTDPQEKNNIISTSPQFDVFKEKLLPFVRRWEKQA